MHDDWSTKKSASPVEEPTHRFSGVFARLALGLLGWEFKDGTLQAKGGLFPWHDESLKELFDRVSEAGVDQVQELFENWQSE